MNVVLEIETIGAKKILKKYGDENVVSIYILPPNMKELEKRLKERNTESLEIIKKRIAKARREVKKLDMFDYVVVNDDLKVTIKDIKNIIKQEMKKDTH